MNATEAKPPVYLLTVNEAFLISGRGCLLTPGLLEIPSISLERGDRVRLERPNNDPIESVVHGIDAVHNRNANAPEIHFFVTLPPSMSKESVPKGTKLVWLGPVETAQGSKQ